MIRPIAFALFIAAAWLAITGWGAVAFFGLIVAVGVGTALVVDHLDLDL